jgi:hypothetical protein
MEATAMTDSFLGRWSRRKAEAREGRPLEPEPPRAEPPLPAPAPAPAPVAQAEPAAPVAEAPPTEPPPTLEDARLLTPASDFRRFVRPDVAPEVRNAALKQLFADPRFNVQDGLDVYIDDYSRPDPLPAAMLRKMVSAQALGLFRDDEHKDATQAGPSASTEELAAGSVAQSQVTDPEPSAPAAAPVAPDPDHAHPDLRLQQDDAAPGPQPGHGTG